MQMLAFRGRLCVVINRVGFNTPLYHRRPDHLGARRKFRKRRNALQGRIDYQAVFLAYLTVMKKGGLTHGQRL